MDPGGEGGGAEFNPKTLNPNPGLGHLWASPDPEPLALGMGCPDLEGPAPTHAVRLTVAQTFRPVLPVVVLSSTPGRYAPAPTLLLGRP